MAALMRLIFMFVLMFMIVVFVVVIMIFVFIVIVVMMFMERAFLGVQSLVYDNADGRRASVGMVVMIHLQNQSRFAFLDTLQVETPAAAGVYVKNFFVGDIPGEGMFVICRGLHFFLVIVKELHVDMFAHAVCVHVHHFDGRIGLAAVNAVGKLPVAPIKVPAFGFKMFVLVGRGAVAVAAGGKEYAEDDAKNGKGKGLDQFHVSLV